MRYAFTLLVVLSAFVAKATTYTLISGSWESQAVSLVNGDVLRIPEGAVVTTSSVLNFPVITMNIQGKFTFQNVSPKPKWSLSDGSVINVFATGIINSSASSPAIQLTIGGNVVYNGSNPPVTGPSTASSTSNNFEGNTALPVRLLDFSAATAKNQVVLKWTAINDNISAAFVVEKSLLGSDWTLLTTVAAPGDGQKAAYSYTDGAANGTVFYRIGYKNSNGAMVYSSVAKVTLMAPGSPVVIVKQDGLQLQFENSNSRTIRVSDLTGRTVVVANVTASQATIPANVQPGMYIITITEGKATVYSGKFIW